MSTVTINRTFKVDGVLTDADTFVLRDSTGTFGLKRDDTGAVLYPVDTAFSKTATGTYIFSFTAPAAALTYTYGIRATYGGETYIGDRTFTAPTVTGATGIGYTNTTLGEAIRGILNVDPDSPGGAVPDRIMDAVIEAGMQLWNNWPWNFRRKSGTLTTTAGTASADAPTDFHQLDQKWLRDLPNTDQTLRFTEDPAEYQVVADDYESTDTGEPRIALVVWNSAGKKWVFDWTPTAESTRTYDYWYLMADPWTTGAVTDNTTEPPFPPTFHLGWRLLATAACQRMYGTSDDYKAAMQEFKDWLADHRGGSDRTSTEPDRIQNGYNDVAHLTSQRVGVDLTWP